MFNSKHKRLAHRVSLGLALGVASFVVLTPIAAQAQRRSPLADAPAIRKRVELRSTRLEFGAGAATTLNQDFFHTVMAELKLGFHFTDFLSVSGIAGFAVANMETGFQSRLSAAPAAGGLPTDAGSLMREPTVGEAKASMTKINQLLGAQLEVTPFTGKYSLAGKLFAHYDFYLFAGGGALNVAPAVAGGQDCGSIARDPNGGPYSCAVSGLKPGFTGGVGFHTFFNDFIALNVELRDVFAKMNPAGRDVNGDQVANNSDLQWTHTYFLGANIVLYLPATPEISP